MKRLKLPMLYFLSFLLSCLPVLIFVAVNPERYISSVYDGAKLFMGGAIACAFLIMKALGKLKLPSRVGAFFAVFLMSYLFESLLSDLMTLSALALLGEVMDMAVQAIIRREKRKAQDRNTSSLVESAMGKYAERL